MNTHLHLLEAFANLYKIWKDRSLRQRICEIIRIFLDHIIDRKTDHLILFFDDEWKRQGGNIISYGHDIEAAWLLQEVAEIIEDDPLLDEVKTRSVKMVQAASKGLDGDGGLWYEYDALQQHLTREKHSWPQAEAMVGFFNAWQLTEDEKFLRWSLQSWEFVKEYMLDKKLGECSYRWHWQLRRCKAIPNPCSFPYCFAHCRSILHQSIHHLTLSCCCPLLLAGKVLPLPGLRSLAPILLMSTRRWYGSWCPTKFSLLSFPKHHTSPI